MKFGTGIGIVISMLGIAMGATMEGTNVMVVLNVPAILIVLIGTLGATIAACGLPAHIKLPKLFVKALMPEDLDLVGRVNEIVGFAEKARRDGLLALDEAVKDISDPFTKKGIQLVVDGTDPDLVAAVLDAETRRCASATACPRPVHAGGRLRPHDGHRRHGLRARQRDEQPEQPVGARPADRGGVPRHAHGRRLGDVVFLPMANRLKQLSEQELHFREMTLEGILGIQAGDNPRVVAEKLMAYVPPSERPSEEEQAAAASAQKQAA